MARYVILPIIFLLTIFTSVLYAVTVANIPPTTGEWVEFALWRLETNGLTGPIYSSSRPFDRNEIAYIVADIRKRIESGDLNPTDIDLQLINKLESEFCSSQDSLQMRGLLAGETKYYNDWGPHSISVWGAADFNPTPNIELYEELIIAKDRDIFGFEGKTASQRTNPWRWDYTADFKRAYARFHREPFEVLLGRQSLFWGPAYTGSLILSDNSPAFDMILLKATFGPVEAISFSAVLDKKWSERGDPPYRYLAHRYLSGHRLDWAVSDRLELGISELILYGGEARNIEIQYVNPILPYYATQWNENKDDNLLASADFALRPIDKLKIYGQLLIDDFQYAGDSPHSLGYIAGFYLSNPLKFSGADLRAEYTRINTWTYTHRVTENQFTHFGWIIGHHLGSDADQWLMELSQIINMDIRLKLIYTYNRQGGHTVEDRYIGENLEEIDFPSGIVEKQHKIKLQFLWEPISGPQVNISCGGIFTRDQGDFQSGGLLNISAGFYLR